MSETQAERILAYIDTTEIEDMRPICWDLDACETRVVAREYKKAVR